MLVFRWRVGLGLELRLRMHTPPFINMRVVVDDSDVRLSLWWWGGQLGVCRCLALFGGGLHMEVQMGGSRA